MKAMPYTRRAVIILCVVAILFAALTHPGTSLLAAILVPLWFFFAAVASLPIPSPDECSDALPFPVFSVFSPRPPPVR